MKAFQYERPASLDEAIALLAPLDPAESGRHLTKALAGGTDLLTLMKGEIVRPGLLVDLKRLPDLDDTIELTAEGHTIAHHTFSHPLLNRMTPDAAEREIQRGIAAVDRLTRLVAVGWEWVQYQVAPRIPFASTGPKGGPTAGNRSYLPLNAFVLQANPAAPR